MRRWLKRIGIGLGSLLCVLAALAWYISGLPWRNRCGDPPLARPSSGSPPNSAVATSQPLATKAAADVLTEGGSAADAAVAAALMLAVAEPGNSGLGGGGFALVHESQNRQRHRSRLSRTRTSRPRRWRVESRGQGQSQRAPNRTACGRGPRRMARTGRSAPPLWEAPALPSGAPRHRRSPRRRASRDRLLRALLVPILGDAR